MGVETSRIALLDIRSPPFLQSHPPMKPTVWARASQRARNLSSTNLSPLSLALPLGGYMGSMRRLAMGVETSRIDLLSCLAFRSSECRGLGFGIEEFRVLGLGG